MKTLTLRALAPLCLFFILMFSCKKEKHSSPEETPGKITDHLSGISNDMKNMLVNMGFSLNDIKDGGEYLIAENDLVIDKKVVEAKLAECQGSGTATNRASQFAVDATGVVDWNKVSNIKFFIHPSITGASNATDWTTAIRAATQDWQNIPNVNIHFTEVNDINDADVTFYDITYSGLPACFNPPASPYAGLGIVPINGNVGSIIGLKISGAFSNDAKISLAKHEIGHTLGFRHSSQEAANPTSTCVNPVYGDNQLPLTPVGDPSSVMFNGSMTSYIPFDTYDIWAAQCLYPSNCCAPAIASYQLQPLPAISVRVSFVVDLSPENPLFNTYTLELYLTSSQTLVSSQELARGANHLFGQYLPKAVYTNPGTYFVKIKGKNYKGDFESAYSTIYL